MFLDFHKIVYLLIIHQNMNILFFIPFLHLNRMLNKLYTRFCIHCTMNVLMIGGCEILNFRWLKYKLHVHKLNIIIYKMFNDIDWFIKFLVFCKIHKSFWYIMFYFNWWWNLCTYMTFLERLLIIFR